MLMSQGAMSAGAIGWPNLGGVCADAMPVRATTAAPIRRFLRIDIDRLPLLVDPPALDRIVVILAAQAALGRKGGARRLHHAGVVGGAALQHHRTAVPLPGRAEAHRRLRQDRAREGSRCPTLSAVGRNLDLPDAAVARPGKAGDFVEARPFERETRRRSRDDRLDLEREHELPGLLVLEQDRVLGGLVL